MFDLDFLINSFNLPLFQDATGTNDFDAGDNEEEFVIRTVDPPCYLNNQSPILGEPSTTVHGEHQSEDTSPPTEPAANEQVSSHSTEQAVPTEGPSTANAPDLNQSNLESIK